MSDLLTPPPTSAKAPAASEAPSTSEQEGTGHPRIDPRFARRWIEARREEGRRRLRILAVAGGVALAVLIAVGVLYSPLVKVRHVRITVAGGYPPATVRHLAGLDRQVLMIDVDGAAVARRLDADPWLGGARVSRVWPGTVRISVVTRTAVAGVSRGGPGATGAPAAGWAEVDATGRVLADVPSLPAGLPVITGLAVPPPPGQWLARTPGPQVPPGARPSGLVDMQAAGIGPNVPSPPSAALAVLSSLDPVLRSDVTTVAAGRGALSLVIVPPRLAAGSVTVVFGDGSQLQAKITALLTILDRADLSGVGLLDLTVPDRPVAGPSAARSATNAATQAATNAATSATDKASGGRP